MITNLFLLRHFETASTKKGAFYGATDIALSKAGFATAQKQQINSIDDDLGLFCSPLIRCRQTAAAVLPNKQFSFIDDAKEIDFGRWEGMTFDEISKNDQQLVEAWGSDENFEFPDGESLKAFDERIRRLVFQLLQNKNERCLLIAHGGVIRHLICHFLGLSAKQSLLFQVDTGSLTHLKIFNNGKGILQGLGLKEKNTWQTLFS